MQPGENFVEQGTLAYTYLWVRGFYSFFRAMVKKDNGSKCITQNTSIIEEMNDIEVQLSKYL